MMPAAWCSRIERNTFFLQFEILARVRHQGDVVGLEQPALDSHQHFGEEWIGKVV